MNIHLKFWIEPIKIREFPWVWFCAWSLSPNLCACSPKNHHTHSFVMWVDSEWGHSIHDNWRPLFSKRKSSVTPTDTFKPRVTLANPIHKAGWLVDITGYKLTNWFNALTLLRCYEGQFESVTLDSWLNNAVDIIRNQSLNDAAVFQ